MRIRWSPTNQTDTTYMTVCVTLQPLKSGHLIDQDSFRVSGYQRGSTVYSYKSFEVTATWYQHVFLLSSSLLSPRARCALHHTHVDATPTHFPLNYVMAAGSATVSGAVELFGSSECSQWRSSLDFYEEVVRLLTSQKKRSKGESLLDLDKWSASQRTSHPLFPEGLGTRMAVSI